MFRRVVIAALLFTAAAWSQEPTPFTDTATFTIVQGPLVIPGLKSKNQDLQRLRNIRSIAGLESYGAGNVRQYFEEVGSIYRDSGFSKIGVAFGRAAPLLERAFSGDPTITRGEAHRATRRFTRTVLGNRDALPDFRKSYESQVTFSGISVSDLSASGATRQKYPNYSGLALFFAGKLDDILLRAAKGHRATRNLGGVPPRLWMIVEHTIRGKARLVKFNGPLVLHGKQALIDLFQLPPAVDFPAATSVVIVNFFGTSVFFGTSTITTVPTDSNSEATLNLTDSTSTATLTLDNLVVSSETFSIGGNYDFLSDGITFLGVTGTTLTIDASSQLVAWPPDEDVPDIGTAILRTISGVPIPEGYTIHLVPAGTILPASAVVLAGHGESVTLK